MDISKEHATILAEITRFIAELDRQIEQDEHNEGALKTGQLWETLDQRSRDLEKTISNIFPRESAFTPRMLLRIIEDTRGTEDYLHARANARVIFNYWNSLEVVNGVLEPKVYETWPGFLESLGIQVATGNE